MVHKLETARVPNRQLVEKLLHFLIEIKIHLQRERTDPLSCNTGQRMNFNLHSIIFTFIKTSVWSVDTRSKNKTDPPIGSRPPIRRGVTFSGTSAFDYLKFWIKIESVFSIDWILINFELLFSIICTRWNIFFFKLILAGRSMATWTF